MTANRGLFFKLALAACTAVLIGLSVPASATEADGGTAQRASRTAVAKVLGWRSAAVQARRDHRPYCAWCGRQFVLMLGVGY